jgi:hypothetical protein
MMRNSSPLLAILLLLASAPAARAQDARLEQVLERFAAAWARGDVAAITALTPRSGVSVETERGALGVLAQRQAAAAIRRLFDGRQTVSIRPGMAQVVGGSPPRAFGELTWTTRSRGTTVTERAVIFLALVKEGDNWRITQIRILR